MFRLSDSVWWGSGNDLADALAAGAQTVLSVQSCETDRIHWPWPTHPIALFLWIPIRDDRILPRVAGEMFAAAASLLAHQPALLPVYAYCRAGQERSMAVATFLHSILTQCSFDEACEQAKRLRPDGMRHELFQESFAAFAGRSIGTGY